MRREVAMPEWWFWAAVVWFIVGYPVSFAIGHSSCDCEETP